MKKLNLVWVFGIFAIMSMFLIACTPEPSNSYSSSSLTNERINYYGGTAYSYFATLKNTSEKASRFKVTVFVYNSNGEEVDYGYAEYYLEAGGTAKVVIDLSFYASSYTYRASATSYLN